MTEPATPPNALRVYSPRRGRAHFITAGGSNITFCGIDPKIGFEWHGTGTQDEYEEAARRQLCDRCARRVAFKVRRSA